MTLDALGQALARNIEEQEQRRQIREAYDPPPVFVPAEPAPQAGQAVDDRLAELVDLIALGLQTNRARRQPSVRQRIRSAFDD